MAYEWQDVVPAEVAASMRGDHMLGVFCRIDTATPLRWWLGVADIPAGFDAIDENDDVYLGGGGPLLEMPTLEALLNGAAGEVVFRLSGVDVGTGQEAYSALPEVRGKEVRIGVTTLDDHYQPRSAICPLWRGVASHPVKDIPPMTGGGPRGMVLELVAMSGNSSRSRAARVFLTPAHFQSRHPGDRFCDQVPELARGVNEVWPRW